MTQNQTRRKQVSPSVQRQELLSWKEIGDYLGVTPRTAQKWEVERGLPVRRLPGGRARVSAQVAELEIWKNSKSYEGNVETKTIEETALQEPDPLIPNGPENVGNTGISVQNGASEQAQPRRKVWWSFLAGAGLLAVGLVASLTFLRNQPGSPAQWKFMNNTLVVFDDVGRVLWRKTFDKELHMPRYSTEPVHDPTNVWFGDLEGDGTIETLFVQQSLPRYAESTALICFSESGAEKWRFVPGKPISTKTLSFETLFYTRTFKVAQLGRGLGKSVVVMSHQYLRFPVQVAVVSDQGKLLREYWHSGMVGYPDAMEFGDFDHNGLKEIYLGGVNNARQQATLVVLDPETMEGASAEEDPKYQLQGFAPGKEIARVLFPRTCINQKFERYNRVQRLILNRDSITADISEAADYPHRPSVLFDLLADLTLKRFTFSEVFIGLHATFNIEKRLNHSLSAAEERAMHNIQILRSATQTRIALLNAE